MREEDNFMFPLIDKKATGNNLRRIMDMRGISAKDVQEYLRLGCVQSVYRWLDGTNMPTIDNLYALSELFQLPMDEIVCGNRSSIVRKTKLELLDLSTRRMYLYYQKLNKMQVA
jgi:transcriptional regulator with XRE-family HTH domain